jgi:hypothetical protein
MPRYGTADVATWLPDAPLVLSAEGPTWEMPDAQFLQINWEVDDDAAMALTPPSLHPSIPSYASFFAGRYPDSPVGPFTLVQVRLVVRAGIRPRALCLGAVCDNRDATQALREHWGYPVALGEAWFTARHHQIAAGAVLDGRTVAELAVPDPEVIGGNDLMAFDNLHLIRLGEPATGAIIQVDPEYSIHSADRSVRPRVHLPDPEALGMGGLLRLTSPMVGFTFRADTDLVPVRFAIDPTKPALQSTRRLDRAAV